MAFDGIVIANIISDMKVLIRQRISKISEPEHDEIVLTFNMSSGTKKLLISANAAMPLIYFTEENKPSPAVAPVFCMLLRKHIGNGRIIDITQPGFERIVKIEIEHLDELGDLSRKYLIFEMMGKYSNIIFTDSNNKILDSIKRVPASISSLREVLPGREYFLPKELTKSNTIDETYSGFISRINNTNKSISRLLTERFSGISPVISSEICFRAGIDEDTILNPSLSDKIYASFEEIVSSIKARDFKPQIYYKDKEAIEFSSISLSIYDGLEKREYEDASSMIIDFYKEKELRTRIRQKTSDIRKITDTLLERASKKLDLQEKQLKDTAKKDNYRLYGELLRTYSYSLTDGISKATLDNYYDGSKVTITLDPTLTISENATRYYNKYQKQRRTAIALESLIEETRCEVEHLSSILSSIGTAETETEIAEIKDELARCGYIKQSSGSKKTIKKSEPLHFISSDGYHIFVGKNNYQNEELTFNIADSEDIWFHAKGRPGSHVILKTDGKEPSDKAYEEAGALAAYYSSANRGEKVEIDYTSKKNIKKPRLYRPGLVIYHTNYSLIAVSDIKGIKRL